MFGFRQQACVAEEIFGNNLFVLSKINSESGLEILSPDQES